MITHVSAAFYSLATASPARVARKYLNFGLEKLSGIEKNPYSLNKGSCLAHPRPHPIVQHSAICRGFTAVTGDSLRIAILGINYAPEEIGIARYTTDMALALSARGHHVEVIAGKPYYPQWNTYPPYRKRGWLHETERGVPITRCPHYVPAQPNGRRRILHLASFAMAALGPALRLVFRQGPARPQVVICVVPALLSVPVAWLAARLAGARLWVHVQDFEVEAAFATGLITPSGGIAKWAKSAEIGMLQLADRISTISPQMCARLVKKGIQPDRVVQIRNWADEPGPETPEDRTSLRQAWGLGKTRVALYSGNIANKQGITILIEAARLTADRHDIMWVICGQGPYRAALEALQGRTP